MGRIADIVNAPEFASKSPLEKAQARRDLFALAIDEHPEVKAQFEAADDAGKQTLADQFKAKLTADFPEAFKTDGYKIEIGADGTRAIYGGHQAVAAGMEPSKKWEGPRTPVYDIATEQILHAAADPANREKFAALPADTRKAMAPFLYERYGPEKVDESLFGKPEDFVEREESGTKKTLKFAVPALFRIAPPAVASITKNPKMIAGAAALGDAAAQSIEKSFGTRATFSPVEMGLSAGLSVIPAATIGKLSNPALNVVTRAGVRATEGAAQGAVFEGVRQAVDEGGLDGDKIAMSAGIGAGFGSIVGALEPRIAALIAGKTAREAADTLTDAATRATPEQRAAITTAQQRIEEMLQVSAAPTAEQTAARQADVSTAVATEEAQAAARASLDASLGVGQPNAELAALKAKLGTEEATAAAENATRAADFEKARAEDIQSTVKTGQLEGGETVILGDDPVKNQITAIETRPGESARERAQLEASVEATTPKVDDGSIRPDLKLSAQAQSIYDQYGFISPKLATSLAGGATGTVYGASGDVEGDTVEEQLGNRIKRGLAFGVVGIAGGYMAGRTFTSATLPKVAPGQYPDIERWYKHLAPPDAEPLAQRMASWPNRIREAIITKFAPLDRIEAQIAGANPGMTVIPSPLPLSRKFEQVAGASGKGLQDVRDFERNVVSHIKPAEARDFDVLLAAKRTGQRLQWNQNLAIEQARIQGIPKGTRSPDEIALLEKSAGLKRVGTEDLASVDRTLQQLHAKLGARRFAELDQLAAGAFQQELDEVLRLQVAAGRLSNESYDAIRAGNDFYAPFRVLRSAERFDGAATAGAVDTRKQIASAIEGIDDPNFHVDSPTRVAAEQIFNGRVLAEKNLKMLELAKLADLDQSGSVIRKLRDGEEPRNGFEAVNYFDGGKPMRIEVAPAVARAVKGLNASQSGVIGRFAQTLGAAFRFGATSANAAFQGRNLVAADQPRLLLMSKYGAQLDPREVYQIPMDFVHALIASAMKNVARRETALSRAFYESGAAGSTLQDAISRIGGRVETENVAQAAINGGRGVIDTIQDITRVLEETTKMMGFKRGVRIEGIDSMPPAEAAEKLQEVVTEIRNFAGSPDFARHGGLAKDMNMLFVFFNARLQGVTGDVTRLVGGDGAKVARDAWIRLGATAGLASAYFWFRNQDPENKADFAKLSHRDRENFLWIPRYDDAGAPLYGVNAQGEKFREYFTVPKRESAKTISNLTAAALDFTASREPEALAQFGVNFIEDVSPINITGRNGTERVESAIGNLNPLLRVPYEVVSNRDTFRHAPIVPASRQGGADPTQQYFPGRTPHLYVKAAKAMPQMLWDPLRSPLMLQQAVQGLTGGLVTQFTQRRNAEQRDSTAAALAANPVTRMFVGTSYRSNGDAESVARDVKATATDARVSRDNATLAEFEKMQAMPSDQRRQHAAKLGAENPALFEAVMDEVERHQKGFDGADRIAATLGVRDGARAEYLRRRIDKLPASERRAFVEDQFAKGILTDEVWEQIVAPLTTGK